LPRTSRLLGVAGGELIIPTLLFAFGVEVKTAGTTSLLISIPTIVAALWQPRGSAEPRAEPDVMALVVPMSAGSIAGALLGGVLVAAVSGAVVKLLLGVILIVSARRVFRAGENRCPECWEMEAFGAAPRTGGCPGGLAALARRGPRPRARASGS
jgi:uncharacterized membrane protein YfcA